MAQFVPYHGESPKSRNGARLRPPYPIMAPDYKQLLDEVSVISRMIKVEVIVIRPSLRLRLITLFKSLIILDITKTECNYSFIIHWTQKLGSHVSSSSLTAGNTSRAKLTRLPLEIMHMTWSPVTLSVLDMIIVYSAVITSRALISKIHCTLYFGQSEKS